MCFTSAVTMLFQSSPAAGRRKMVGLGDV